MRFLRHVLVLWAAMPLVACDQALNRAAAADPSARPNFIVILCDDLGYGDLGCFGHPHIQTPNLDRLAAQGMRLTDCYAAAPVCSPSRVGLLTGRTPNRVGVYDWIPHGHPMHMGAGEKTIATQLRAAGYDTGQFGKWHCNGKFNSPEQPQPDDHGFGHWFATQNNAAPSHADPKNFVRNGKPVGPLEGFACQIVTDEAIAWLEARKDPAKPFFQFICFHEPHEPVASPPDLVKRYEKVARNHDEAQYFANVANVDRAVGRLMKHLDAAGLADNTVVFFTSDNGPETLNRYKRANRSYGTTGPLRGMKLWVYDGGIRVPGILRWPARVKPGQTVSEPVCSLDLLPTFCELGGAKLPGDRALDGASLAGWLARGESIERKTPLYWNYYRAFPKPKVAMREGDWMILGHWDGPDLGPGGSVRHGDTDLIKKHQLVGFELYNVRRDLAQQNDLADAEPNRLRRMAERLKAKYAEVQAEGPAWNVPARK